MSVLLFSAKCNFFVDDLELGTAETTEEEKDVNVWEDNWDDDVVEDDFSNQLRYTQEIPLHRIFF